MKTSKVLYYFSWFSSIYFILLALNQYVIKSKFVLIGVVQELITLPIMFAQFVICITSFIFGAKANFNIKEYSFWAFVISLLNSLIVIGTILGYVK
jgi:hypothetical protein